MIIVNNNKASQAICLTMAGKRRIRRLAAVIFVILLAISTASAEITVGPQNADYDSFTQAVYETVDSGEDIVVFPGEYDIQQEYLDYFGIDTLNDQTELGNGFQYGVRLHDRNVKFLPGTRIRCVWYFPTDYTARFCPIYVGNNVILEGLDLYAEGTEYAIHDDIWQCDEPYVNEYHHCRVIGKNLFGANCIGGGVAQNSRIIIDNCYFDNNAPGSVTARYHNTAYENAEGDIWISDTYFNGYFAASYYGTSSHLNVYVNGCKAQKIETRQETADSVIENIDLFSWNNEIE